MILHYDIFSFICLLFDDACPHWNVSSVWAENISTLFTAVYLQCLVDTQQLFIE